MGLVRQIVKVLSIICYVAVGLYVLVLLPMIIGFKPLVVLSGSMEPKYGVGSVIYYEEVDTIKVNDVIVFEMRDAPYVTHRVIEIDNGKYVTKGDANNFVDPEKVELQAVKGKVINFNIPILGYYIYFINTNFWAIVVIVLILVSDFLLTNVRSDDIEEKNALEGGKKYEK